MIEKIFMRQHLTRYSLGGIGSYRTCSWQPAEPACRAGIALRSQTGFEEGYSLLVVKPLGDDDDLYSVEPRFSVVRNIDRLSSMATLICAPTL
jgi:hypothetical protein